jgi:hypothetical protein
MRRRTLLSVLCLEKTPEEMAAAAAAAVIAGMTNPTPPPDTNGIYNVPLVP